MVLRSGTVKPQTVTHLILRGTYDLQELKQGRGKVQQWVKTRVIGWRKTGVSAGTKYCSLQCCLQNLIKEITIVADHIGFLLPALLHEMRHPSDHVLDTEYGTR